MTTQPQKVCAECANPIDADSGSDLCGPCWRHWDNVDNTIDEYGRGDEDREGE